MKTFEERYTAWIDGQLGGDALATFEKELEAHPDAAADRAAAQKIGELLRMHAAAPALSNADFFNLQLRQRLEADAPRNRAEPEQRAAFWSFSRLIWAGAASLAVAGLLYQTIIPASHGPVASDYFAQVVEAWPSDPSISATTVYNAQDNVTVLWLDGLDYMPGEQLALQ